MRYALLCLMVLMFASAASAQDNAIMGDPCAEDSHYSVGPRDVCIILCNDLVNGGAASCQPTAIDLSACEVGTVSFAIEKAQASCEPGTINIRHSDSSVVGDPNVWHTIATLTGVVSPLISEQTISFLPKKNLRAELTSIADPQCTAVDVTARCQRK